jgi:hypothetical protein
VFIVAVGLTLSQVAWAAPPTKETHHNQPAATTQTPQPPDATKVETKRPDYNLDSCYQSPDQQNADLCAQWRAAIAAEKAAKLTVQSNRINLFGAVLSFASVVLVLIALHFARQANAITRAC